jgi:hypothetical protein
MVEVMRTPAMSAADSLELKELSVLSDMMLSPVLCPLPVSPEQPTEQLVE